jgi:hypothetical protein
MDTYIIFAVRYEILTLGIFRQIVGVQWAISATYFYKQQRSIHKNKGAIVRLTFLVLAGHVLQAVIRSRGVMAPVTCSSSMQASFQVNV